MTRSQFFKRTLGAVLVSVGLSKVAKAQPKILQTTTVEELMMQSGEAKRIWDDSKPRNYLQTFRDHYEVIDGEGTRHTPKILFKRGVFKTSDPKLIESLRNHPRCKK